MSNAQPLAPNDYCTGNFIVKYNHVYFQAGANGPLKRVPCSGGDVKTLHESAGYLAVDGGWVFFQADTSQAEKTGLYRVQFDADPDRGDKAIRMHNSFIGHLAAPGDGYVYFQDQGHGLCRRKWDDNGNGTLEVLVAQGLSKGHLFVHGGYVYFQSAGLDDGKLSNLCRVPCAGGKWQKLYEKSGYTPMAIDGDWVYFQAGDDGHLKRVPCAGGDPHELDENGGYLAVRNDWVYFQAGSHGLYRVKCDGSVNTAVQMDQRGGLLVVPGDGYVYFQAGSKGLYRVPSDGNKAEGLDDRCGNLAIPDPFDGFIYFQGGNNNNGLYRTPMPANCPAPAGFKVHVQDEYVVETIYGPVGDKFNAITALLNQAWQDATDAWFINFTSGASSGAFPDAVAGRINKLVRKDIKDSFSQNRRNRLGTIVMDFPDDNGNTDYITEIFSLNSTFPLSPADWMGDWMRQDPNAQNLKLSQATIPGTHDSCTFNASPMSKCQNLNLAEQLAAGIRLIDIRCRHYGDRFELYHGMEPLGLDFDYVLTACGDFLSRHPNECIVMSIKREYESEKNQKTFQEVFDLYVSTSALRWYLGNTIPTLASVKGQVVLFRRFYVGAGAPCATYGLDLSNWPDDATFTWPS